MANVADLLGKLYGKLTNWLESLVVMLPNFLLALLIVALGALAGRWARRAVQRVLWRVTHNEPISRLLGSTARLAVLGVALLWALGLLHLDRTVTSLLAGVGVIGLALGFAFQDIAANFTAGVLMALNRPFRVGDLVEVAGRQCRVVRVELRATEMETLDGLSVLIPNKEIFQNPIINYTRTQCRRVDLAVGTAYSDDMEHVRNTVLEAVRRVPNRDQEREIEVFFDAFGDSSINSQVRIWLTDSSEIAFLRARSEAMIAIKKAFNREGITIPFPIRTLDFGADSVGGARLDAMKLKVASGA